MRENFEGRSNEIIAKFEKKMREGTDHKNMYTGARQ